MKETLPQLIRWPGMKKMLGISRSTIDRWEAAGKFPRRIHIGENIIAWNLKDVSKWIEEKHR